MKKHRLISATTQQQVDGELLVGTAKKELHIMTFWAGLCANIRDFGQ